MSTVFPEVRIKQFLEVRGIDAQSPALIPAVAAFWKGILYNPEARQKAWNLVSNVTKEQRQKLHQDVVKVGMRAKVGGESIFPILKEFVDLSCGSLGKQKSLDEEHDECLFLSRIREQIIELEQSPADLVLEKWRGELEQRPEKLIQYLSI